MALSPLQKNEYVIRLEARDHEKITGYMLPDYTPLPGTNPAQIVLPNGKWLIRVDTEYATKFGVYANGRGEFPIADGSGRLIVNSDGGTWSLLITGTRQSIPPGTEIVVTATRIK